MLAHAFWLADLSLHIGPIRPDPFQRLSYKRGFIQTVPDP